MGAVYSWFIDGITYEQLPGGSAGSIVRYDTMYAITFGWIIPRRGSVFSWLEQILVTGSLTMLCTWLAFSGCGVSSSNPDTCVQFPPPSTSFLTLMTLSSFVLAFFANNVLTRWWNIRLNLQASFGGANNMIMNCSGMLKATVRCAAQGEEKARIEREAKRLIRIIISHSVLSLQLLFNQSRESKDFHDLMDRNLLDEEEYEKFIACDGNPVHPLTSISEELQVAAHRGLLGKEHLANMNLNLLLTDIVQMRTNIAAVILNTSVQIPYPFVQIVSAVVYAFLIQLIYVCSAFISSGLANPAGLSSHADLTTGYITIILYSFVLLGLLRLFQQLSDPMGDDAADFPGTLYMKNFEKGLLSIRDNAFVDTELHTLSAKISTKGKGGGGISGGEMSITISNNNQSSSDKPAPEASSVVSPIHIEPAVASS